MIIKIMTGLFFYLSPAKNAYSTFYSLNKVNNKTWLSRKIYFLSCFLLFLSLSFAQKKDSVDYFPLNVGDRYDYYEIEYPKVWFAETNDSIKIGKYVFSSIVTDTAKVNGRKYYLMTNFFWYSESDTLRTDSIGNIYIIYHNNEILLYKFNANVNEIWWAKLGQIDWGFRMINKNDTLKLPYGFQHSCIKIIKPGTFPIFFVPNVGRALFCNHDGSFVLGKAKIKGVAFPFINALKESKVRISAENIKSISIFPNPFNSSTIIEYMIPQKGHIKLIIYDILGREIKVLADELNYAGIYRKNWDGKDKNGKTVNSSIYFCKLIVNGYSIIKKLLFIK